MRTLVIEGKTNPDVDAGSARARPLSIPARIPPRPLTRLFRQRLPAGDGPGALPGLRQVGHAGKQPAQLDGGRHGVWRPHYTPKRKKRTALMRELKEVFRRYRSRPIEQVISLIKLVLWGWVNYFAVGHSSECFSFIKDWVEKKAMRQLAHARKRKGFGWERWSRQWLYETLRLFNGYRVRRNGPKVAPAG